MADAIRETSNLQTLFADNLGGNITAQRLRDLTVSAFNRLDDSLAVLGSNNNFTANIGLSTTTFSTNNRLLVNPYQTANTAARVQFTASVASDKVLVLQGYTSQSENLFECQNSSGVVGARVTAARRFSDTGATGNANEVFGDGAGAALNGSSNFNCLIGYDSGKSITSGLGNTIIGYNTGTTITTGGYNTIIGTNSNVSTSGRSNSTLIGSSLTASGDSVVLIGSSLGGGQDAVTVGNSNSGAHVSGVCIGNNNSMSTSDSSIGIGRGVTVSHNSSIVFGQNATSVASGSLSFGWFAISTVTIYSQISTSTTNFGVNGSRIITEWADNTHASRKGRLKFQVEDSSSTREGIRIESTGSAAALGFFAATAVAQQNTTGTSSGFTAGSGTAVNDDSTFTGNVGSTAYRISDIVRALKNYGLMAS